MDYKFAPRVHERLREKQVRFAWMVAELLMHAKSTGYEVTFGEAWRPGDGRCHGVRLAVDLNLFVDGKYRPDTESHRELGLLWESLAPDARWGGHFNDGNHYSLEHNGRK